MGFWGYSCNKLPPIPSELSDYSVEQIITIDRYNTIALWDARSKMGYMDSNAHMQLRAEVAKELNIPLSKIRLAGEHVRNMRKAYQKMISDEYKSNDNMHEEIWVRSTAYGGPFTLDLIITLYGNEDSTDFKSEAKIFIDDLILDLPEWVTGFITRPIYHRDPYLETGGRLDLKFIWKRGQEPRMVYEDIPLLDNDWNYGMPYQYPDLEILK